MKKFLIMSFMACTALFADSKIEQVQARILTGAYFTQDSLTMPNIVIVDNKDCKYLADATYDLKQEKVGLKLTKQSCLINGNITENKIEGFVLENNSQEIGLDSVIYSNTDGKHYKDVTATLKSGRNIELNFKKVD